MEKTAAARIPWYVSPIVLGIGAAFAAVSLYNHTALKLGLNDGPSFCNISAHVNCDAVTQSEYSTFLGLPLDGYGLTFYLSLLLVTLTARFSRRVSTTAVLDATFVLAFLASVLSVALFFISEFVIGALCILCVGMYFANFTLLLVSWASDTSPGFGGRFRRGVIALLWVPRTIVGQHSSSVSRSLWLGCAIVAALVFQGLPRIFAQVQVARNPVRQQIEQVFEMAIQDWESRPVQDIPLNEEGIFRDYTRGSAFAPLQLIEFSDYECPACRNLYFPLEDLLKEFKDKIRFSYRNYPLDSTCNPEMPQPMHASACLTANYARCAGEQGKFWQMNDLIFRLPEIDEGKGPEAVVAALRKELAIMNIDEQSLVECVKSERQYEKIRADVAEGSRLGLQGTPTLWLNGRQVRAANPVVLRRLLEHALEKAEQSR